MMLLILFLLPLLGALLGTLFRPASRYLCLFTILSTIGLTIGVYVWGESVSSLEDFWLLEYRSSWLHFGLDGLSFSLLLTAECLASLAWIFSLERSREQILLLTTLCGVMGLLLAVDLLAFFVFWELMLLPLYFWVLTYGKERKFFAALQFIIFTQLSGLLMLVSILMLLNLTGTLDLNQLSEMHLPARWEFWIASGLTLAFLIKLPAFPFHTWMPTLFMEAPLAGVISGLLLKTSVYGFLRFVLPLFPTACERLAPWMMYLGAFSVVYGALLAFSNKNPRQILAYSTLSHAGLMLMGLFSDNMLALSGVIVLMISQALATAGLFIALETHFGLSLFFAMATLGLPGLGNFVGEWLLLFGLFEHHPWATIVGASGLVLGAAYLLRLVVQLYYHRSRPLLPFGRLQFAGCVLTASILVGIGLWPGVILDLVTPSWKTEVEQPEEGTEIP